MYEKLLIFDSSRTSILTGYTSPPFPIFLIATSSNQCTVRTASMMTKWVNCLGSQNFMSSHCHRCNVTFIPYRQPHFILFLVPLVVIIRRRVHEHSKCKLKYSPITFQSYLFSGDIVLVHEDAKGLFSLWKDSGKFYCCRALYLADWSIDA